jgi:hypothetical protein
MAKLVDALVSGTSVSNDVQVRVLFWARLKTKDERQKKQEKQIFAFGLPGSFIFCLVSWLRPDGEIGRHASLRGWCRQRCASSSLVLGTKRELEIILFFLFAISELHTALCFRGRRICLQLHHFRQNAHCIVCWFGSWPSQPIQSLYCNDFHPPIQYWGGQ